MKQVNIILQCIATLSLPSGLYAFKRINKFRKGVLVYLASFGLVISSLILTTLLFATNDNQYSLVIALYSLGVAAMSFVVPIYYIKLWSQEYNKKIGKENTTSLQAVPS